MQQFLIIIDPWRHRENKREMLGDEDGRDVVSIYMRSQVQYTFICYQNNHKMINNTLLTVLPFLSSILIQSPILYKYTSVITHPSPFILLPNIIILNTYRSLMLSQQAESIPQQLSKEYEQLCPQVKIYNRNFYIRRSEHQKLIEEREREIAELASKPKVNLESYNILVQKLEKELAELMSEYAQEGEVDYQGFNEIVMKMGRFESSNPTLKRKLQQILTQLWLVLVQYNLQRNSIDPEEVQSLLSMLFCPHPLRQSEIVELLNYKYPDLEEKRLSYVQEYPETEDESLTLEEIVYCWLRIRHKYYTPFAAPRKQPVAKQESNFRFQPQINTRSKEMAGRSLQKYLSSNRIDNLRDSKLNELSGYISSGKELSYHQILYRRGLEKEQLMKTSRQQVQPQKEKTLSVEQAKRLVSNLYFTKEKREDVDHQKLKQEEELKLCTFKPEIIGNYHKRGQNANIKNYEKQIERLEKGRREKQKKKQAFQNLGRVKNKNSAPPSFIEREKPRLILEIKVGEKVEELRLKGDEEPRLVAKKFVRMHGLGEEMQQVLESIIQEQLRAL